MVTSVFSLKICKKKKEITTICIFAVVFDILLDVECSVNWELIRMILCD